MTDCTCIYYTANLIPENFAMNIRNHLKESSGGIPIISISHKPIQFGDNVCVELPVSVYSIYKQILMGAEMATTKYIACCEDDALYVPDHFQQEPPEDTFFYNVNRWSVAPQLYFFRHRRLMSMCVASRELMIDTLKARFEKYPVETNIPHFGEPGRHEHRMGLPAVKIDSFKTETPTLIFNHKLNIGGLRQYSDAVMKELPYWGPAEDLWKRMYDEH